MALGTQSHPLSLPSGFVSTFGEKKKQKQLDLDAKKEKDFYCGIFGSFNLVIIRWLFLLCSFPSIPLLSKRVLRMTAKSLIFRDQKED